MANLGATFRGKADLSPPTTPTVYNVSVVLASTEVSQALSSSTKKITIRVRGISTLQLSFTALESGTKFITITRGSSYTLDGISFTGTLYFQTDKASQTVEILEWS